jgi:hypothetical protein
MDAAILALSWSAARLLTSLSLPVHQPLHLHRWPALHETNHQHHASDIKPQMHEASYSIRGDESRERQHEQDHCNFPPEVAVLLTLSVA